MSESRPYERLIMLTCFLCNLSQIPVLFSNRLLGISYMGCWILLLVVLWLNNIGGIQPIHFIWPIVFDIFCVVMSVLNGGYISSDLFRPINLSAFIFLIGLLAGGYLEEESLKKISIAFISSALLVALYLYMNIFRGVDWANSGAYLYASKNSAGQIFLTAVILTALLFLKEHKVLSMGVIAFCTALIIMMKSRATLVTLIIIAIYMLLFVIEKPSYKLLGIICIISMIIIILTNEGLYNLYIKQIMLNNKDIADISGITSDRDIQYRLFNQYFKNYFVAGTGGTYIESMPLAVLMSYGVIGGIPVLLYSLYPLYIGIKNVRIWQYKRFCHIIISLALMMWINGIFEEQSPFGPGVKCYFLWLITGIFLGYKQRNELYDGFE